MSILDRFTSNKKIVTDKDLGMSGGNSLYTQRLPGGLRYNADDVTIKTYRKMRLDPQVSACLNVIKFTMQRVDWYVEGDEKTKKVIEKSIDNVWNHLIRSITKSLWAGYSPNVKIFSLDGSNYVLRKIKDLDPATCKVKTDEKGNFNGFVQEIMGEKEIISPDYAFWYAHQMEDGDLYGNSMIKPSYKPWYYAELLHLFANRYYERFGEPVVVGRAPIGDTVEDTNGTKRDSMASMQAAGEGIRSHTVLTIPGDRDETGNRLYDLEYLESQMRGVDFEVYMKRLDLEKARAIFVPDLLLGSGNVGSYALGLEHKATFITGIMGILDDYFEWINKYIVQQLVELNYPSGEAKLKYTPLSRVTEDAIVDMVRDLVSTGKIAPEIQTLSDRIGIPLKEEKSPPPIEKPAKEVAKKQMTRIRNYLSKAMLNDDKTAVDNLKIGFPEAFNSKRNYTALETEVKNKIRSCVAMGYELNKIVYEVGRTLGVDEDRNEARKILKEEANNILNE